MGFQTHISSVSCIGRRVLYHDHHQGNPDSKINKILSSVQSLSRVRLFATPWTAAGQASLSFTISRSLLKLMSTESVMPSSHLILCCLFSPCSQSSPASGSFPVSWLFTSGGQSIGASASASVLPMNNQGWFPLGLTNLKFMSLESVIPSNHLVQL